MRVLLADDEPVALERLELALAGIPSAEVVARARNGRDALRYMRELRPDIAVLDIEMPAMDGFAAVAGLKAGDHVPEVVFVTAYHEHAVRAFEMHAVDYLLKPVAFDRFREALRRARARLDARAADVRLSELQALVEALRAVGEDGRDGRYENELWTRTRTGLLRIATEDIDYVSAEGDYVLLHVGGASHLMKDTIVSLESRLDPRVFLRIHRSKIVRLACIRGLQRRGSRNMALTLQDGTRLAVGPSYAQAALDALHAKRWR